VLQPRETPEASLVLSSYLLRSSSWLPSVVPRGTSLLDLPGRGWLFHVEQFKNAMRPLDEDAAEGVNWPPRIFQGW